VLLQGVTDSAAAGTFGLGCPDGLGGAPDQILDRWLITPHDN
jgi:hypothetical protein